MHRLECAEIWGGIKNADLDVSSGALTATLFSTSCDGGKGGDVYYFSVCNHDEMTRIAIADVAGHGEAISHLGQWLYDTLGEQMNSPQSAGVLAGLNQVVHARGISAMTTAVVVTFVKSVSTLFYAYAGHPPLHVRRGPGPDWEPVPIEGTSEGANVPLGVEDDTHYDESRLRLESGDRLFLYTDGVVETPDTSGTLLGMGGLRQILGHAVTDDIQETKLAVMDALRRRRGGALDHDDVTMMIVEIR